MLSASPSPRRISWRSWRSDETLKVVRNKRTNVYIDEKIYFNPASSEVNELIVNGVKEIVKNYDVDAIHFDDYFYPTVKEERSESHGLESSEVHKT